MSEATVLKAESREVVGHANRKLAPEGLVPGVLYGAGRDSLPVSILRHDIELYLSHHGVAGILQLELAGESKPVNVLIKDVQLSPVKDRIEHIDFLAVKMNKPIHAVAPLHFIGDAEGVREGGVLNIAVHEVNVEALPANLPEMIEVSVEALEMGATMTIADIEPPSGVTLLDDPETVICSVMMPTVEVEEEEGVEGEEEEAEPELIGEATEEAPAEE